jgi:hypothetical protein
MKKETLEEAAENYCDIPKNQSGDKYKFSAQDRLLYNTFIEGAKWQSERMYSEEDLKRAYLDGCEIKLTNTYHVNKWFEQFKNKQQ